MIKFWKNKNGTLFSHNKGLSKIDLAFFASLKEGDKLVLLENDVKEQTDAAFTLKRSILKDKPRENM